MKQARRIDGDYAEAREVEKNGWRGLIVRPHIGSGLLELFSGETFPNPGFPGKIELTATNIANTYIVTLGQSRFFVKHFFLHRRGKGKLRDFIPDTGIRSWNASLVCERAGIPSPPPVGVTYKKKLGLIAQSVFITEGLENTRGANLEDYFKRTFNKRPLSPELAREKHEIIVMVADLFRKAHGQDRIYFPDFHPHNMVYQVSETGRKLYMVDFDEVRFGVRKGDVMKNLSSLGRNADKIDKKMKMKAITTGDRLRFVKSYLGEEGKDPEKTRKLWRDIESNWNLK